MVEIKYKDKIYKVEDKRLTEIITEAFNSMKAEEKNKGVIGTIGMLSRSSSLVGSSCFGCGDFEDYTGSCRYSSKAKIIKGGGEERLCKIDDISLAYAIEKGMLK